MRVFQIIALMFVSMQSPNSEEKCDLPAVRNQLAERVKVDQEIRRKLIEASRPKKNGAMNVPTDLITKMAETDKSNTTWLKALIKQHGWLGRSLVGEDGAHDAWLLVQHADLDPAFQKECLRLMTAMPKGEVAAVDIAYLTDRTLVADGKLQRYGTQCSGINGKTVVNPVEDPVNLNKRRNELGLGTIEEYLETIQSAYSKEKLGNDDGSNR
ncbi:MAG: DUF6624 domain-containing protein [Planctomycetota bacterium]